MKQKVNFIQHLMNITEQLQCDVNISTVDYALYFTLFLIWNKTGFKDEFIITKEMVMNDTKIGSQNTYHKSLQNLTNQGYIKYTPSKSHRKGSTIIINPTCIKSDTSTGVSSGVSSDTSTGVSSGVSSDTSTGVSSGVIHKHINIETEETLKNIKTSKEHFVGENYKYDFSKINWNLWNVEKGGFIKSIADIIGLECKPSEFAKKVYAKREDEKFVCYSPKGYWEDQLIKYLKEIGKW